MKNINFRKMYQDQVVENVILTKILESKLGYTEAHELIDKTKFEYEKLDNKVLEYR